MRKNDPIANIMSGKIEAVQQGQPLSEVRHMMSEHGVHHVPVLDGKQLVGIISFTDMMKLSLVISGATEHTIDAIIDQQFSIQDVMTTDVTTISEKDAVRDATELLASGGYHSLPVVDGSNNLIGIVTSTDLIRYLKDQY